MDDADIDDLIAQELAALDHEDLDNQSGEKNDELTEQDDDADDYEASFSMYLSYIKTSEENAIAYVEEAESVIANADKVLFGKDDLLQKKLEETLEGAYGNQVLALHGQVLQLLEQEDTEEEKALLSSDATIENNSALDIIRPSVNEEIKEAEEKAQKDLKELKKKQVQDLELRRSEEEKRKKEQEKDDQLAQEKREARQKEMHHLQLQINNQQKELMETFEHDLACEEEQIERFQQAIQKTIEVDVSNEKKRLEDLQNELNTNYLRRMNAAAVLIQKHFRRHRVCKCYGPELRKLKENRLLKEKEKVELLAKQEEHRKIKEETLKFENEKRKRFKVKGGKKTKEENIKQTVKDTNTEMKENKSNDSSHIELTPENSEASIIPSAEDAGTIKNIIQKEVSENNKTLIVDKTNLHVKQEHRNIDQLKHDNFETNNNSNCVKNDVIIHEKRNDWNITLINEDLNERKMDNECGQFQAIVNILNPDCVKPEHELINNSHDLNDTPISIDETEKVGFSSGDCGLKPTIEEEINCEENNKNISNDQEHSQQKPLDLQNAEHDLQHENALKMLLDDEASNVENYILKKQSVDDTSLRKLTVDLEKAKCCSELSDKDDLLNLEIGQRKVLSEAHMESENRVSSCSINPLSRDDNESEHACKFVTDVTCQLEKVAEENINADHTTRIHSSSCTQKMQMENIPDSLTDVYVSWQAFAAERPMEQNLMERNRSTIMKEEQVLLCPKGPKDSDNTRNLREDIAILISYQNTLHKIDGDYGQLRLLCLKNCELETLSSNLKEVNIVDLSPNKLTMLNAFGENLLSLNISRNGISRITSLKHCKNLQHLNVDDNNIISMKVLKDLPYLSILSCRNNEIMSCDDVQYCVLLLELNASGNNLNKVPSLKNNSLLQKLELNNNHLSSLLGLEEFWLPSLQLLSLDGNKINELPILKNLISLESLDIPNNLIGDVDIFQSLCHCHVLQNLNVQGNPVGTSLDYKKSIKSILPMVEYIDGEHMVKVIQLFKPSTLVSFYQQMIIEISCITENLIFDYSLYSDKSKDFVIKAFSMQVELWRSLHDTLITQLKIQLSCKDDNKMPAIVNNNQINENTLKENSNQENTKASYSLNEDEQYNSDKCVAKKTMPEQIYVDESLSTPLEDTKDKENEILQKCSKELSATKIQAVYRGHKVREAYLTLKRSLEETTGSHSSESDFDYNEEVNLDDLSDHELLMDWNVPETPQMILGNPPLPAIPTDEKKVKEAWRTPTSSRASGPLDVSGIQIELSPDSVSDDASILFDPTPDDISIASTKMNSKKAEEISSEWGFQSQMTADLMLRRAKKLGAGRRKKPLNPDQRYRLFKKSSEASNVVVVSQRSSKHVERKSYFQNYGSLSPSLENADTAEMTYSWVHDQTVLHEVRANELLHDGNKNSRKQKKALLTRYTSEPLILPRLDSVALKSRSPSLIQSEIHNPKPPKDRPASGSGRARKRMLASSQKSHSAPSPTQRTNPLHHLQGNRKDADDDQVDDKKLTLEERWRKCSYK